LVASASSSPEIHLIALGKSRSHTGGMASGPCCAHFHAVGFYQNDASLCRMVADFLEEGFREGSPAIIVAAAAHRDAIFAQFRADRVDVNQLTTSGDLLLLDADVTLALFMRDGMPDAAAFDGTFAPIIAQMSRGRKDRPLRAYGEMVDILWKADRQEAAIRLEMLWNQLANTQDFKLLCGYSMGSFYKNAAANAGREEVRQQHSHIVPVEHHRSLVQVG
jgi:hypothetical protein